MSDEEQTRDDIEEIVNDEEFPGVSQDPSDGTDKVPSSPAKETVIETVIEERKGKPVVKAKPKSTSKTENQNNERTSRTYRT